MLDTDTIVALIKEKLEPQDILSFPVISSRKDTLGSYLVRAIGTGEETELLTQLVHGNLDQLNKSCESEEQAAIVLWNYFMTILAVGRVADEWLKDSKLFTTSLYTHYLFAQTFDFSNFVFSDEAPDDLVIMKITIFPTVFREDWRESEIWVETSKLGNIKTKVIPVNKLKKNIHNFYDSVK